MAAHYFRGGITIWDLPGNKEQCQIPMVPGEYVTRAGMAFVDDRQVLVAVLDNYLPLEKPKKVACVAERWDALTGRVLATVEFDSDLRSQAISADGRYAALRRSCTDTCPACRLKLPFEDQVHGLQHQGVDIVFDLATVREQFRVRGGRLILANDGSVLVSYKPEYLSIWEVPSGKLLSALNSGPDFSQTVIPLLFLR